MSDIDMRAAQIVAAARHDVEIRQRQVPLETVKELALETQKPLPVLDALGSEGSVTVIAELKRISPSTGTIAQINNPEWLANEYIAGGAAMISVTTNRRLYGGSLADLVRIRPHIQAPILVKDLLVSPYQIHEARAAGADMILVSAPLLAPDVLLGFIERIHSLGMVALVDVYSRLQALQALDAGAEVVGINARDLFTGEVNMENFAQIVDVLPQTVIAVAESGVRTPQDVFRYAEQGADCVLIGEALVRSDNPQATVSEMVAAGSHPAVSGSRTERIDRANRKRSER
ncbi:MAG: indole-3-glycerol phosphate synthase TrpC [Varibaculum sp.]|nr:indole-3-glycerol phosphate synthase TrpC [Varibaculum sp.]